MNVFKQAWVIIVFGGFLLGAFLYAIKLVLLILPDEGGVYAGLMPIFISAFYMTMILNAHLVAAYPKLVPQEYGIIRSRLLKMAFTLFLISAVTEISLYFVTFGIDDRLDVFQEVSTYLFVAYVLQVFSLIIAIPLLGVLYKRRMRTRKDDDLLDQEF